MSECQYAIKARFSKGKLKKVFADIKTFWKQGQDAREWWQNSRDATEGFYDVDKKLRDDCMKEFKQAKAQFWTEFKQRYPLVAEMLAKVKSSGHVNGVWTDLSLVMTHDPRNALAGVINFGSFDDEPEQVGDVLVFSSEVSTSADWNGISNYLKKKYKAKAVKWVSEDDMSITDFLDV